MPNQSVALLNAIVAAYEATIGAAPTLEIRSGAKPANATDADTGTLLASMTLPADWMAAPSAGLATLIGSWVDAAADAAGTAGHFRIKQGATVHDQGTVSMPGGGGRLILDNTNIAANQQVQITAFSVSVAAGF